MVPNLELFPILSSDSFERESIAVLYFVLVLSVVLVLYLVSSHTSMDFVFKEEEILIHFTILGTDIDILLTTGMTINLDSGRRQACTRIKS